MRPMKVMTMKATVGSDGRLRLDIPAPGEPGPVDLVLVIHPSDEASSESRRYDFSDLAGRLSWSADAVAEQRRLRDEW